METACPGEPEKVQLLKAGIGNLELSWTPIPTGKFISKTYIFTKFLDFLADSYILQIQRFEAPIEQTPSTPTVPSQTTLNHPSIPLQSISASLFASKSPQSGKRNLLFIKIFFLLI